MSQQRKPIRVLYSFPHKLGASRICYTAWQQVSGLAGAGADVLVFPGALTKPVSSNVRVVPTLAKGRLRIPYKLIGSMRAFALHDYIVSRRIEKLAGQIDIVHTWPLGALRTLKTSARLGIPTVLERPNAHTRFAYEVVQRECERLGVELPPDHEHAYKPEVLRIEEQEYQLADRLLCPSEFVAKTFLDRGFRPNQLARHFYGVDARSFCPGPPRERQRPFTMIFVGACAVRKGLHFALEAWLKSPASRDGKFLIVGSFIPSYERQLRPMLSEPSVKVLGHRQDVADLMRASDVFVLPTLEEGSALVTSEARACGCVLLVSEASGAICRHGENALVHRVGDVRTLSLDITRLYEDQALLARLRDKSLSTVNQITWTAAGVNLLNIYREIIGNCPEAGLSSGVDSACTPLVSEALPDFSKQT
ncbi:MAG: glycosyltransferase family 4 protein [Candidatus Sulfotelmatobacter sp.]